MKNLSRRKNIYIASCSFGKDSIATILLALENKLPLDVVVYSEVMYDNTRGISGEFPEHREWIPYHKEQCDHGIMAAEGGKGKLAR